MNIVNEKRKEEKKILQTVGFKSRFVGVLEKLEIKICFRIFLNYYFFNLM